MKARTTMLLGPLAAVTLLLTAWGSTPSQAAQAPTGRAGAPRYGGTLSLVGTNAPAVLDPVAAYNSGNRELSYADSRLLFMYTSQGSLKSQTTLQPDIATEIPTVANGGISPGGDVVTVHIRKGVKWDSSPPRQVVAADFVREFKMLCNPVTPVPAPEYYLTTFVGMQSYCSGFAKVAPTVSAIADYEEHTALPGIVAKGPYTLVFHLFHRTSDILNILAMEFSAARPVEYMSYLPNSAQLDQHLLSDGPYRITSYNPGVSMTLGRNPDWSRKTDPLRHAYVNAIQLSFGVSADNVIQQLQAGTADLPYVTAVPPQDIPGFLSSHNPDFVTSPGFSSVSYLALNMYAGPMANKLVREAVAYAVDKDVQVQLNGGAKLATATDQMSLPGSSGYVRGFEPYNDDNGTGNPTKARQLLAQAGYPNGVHVTLAYSAATGSSAQAPEAYQASLQAAGFDVALLPLSPTVFTDDMRNPANAKKDQWDIAPAGWGPDWYGNNGRAGIVPMLENPGLGSIDYGGYNSSTFDTDVSLAIKATSSTEANVDWQKADEQAVRDVAVVPVLNLRHSLYHASQLEGCTQVWWYGLGCNLTAVWLK